MDLKKCTNCGLSKPVDDFRWLRKLNRRVAKCYQCELEYQRKRSLIKKKMRVGITDNVANRFAKIIFTNGLRSLEEVFTKYKEMEMTSLEETKENVKAWAKRTGLNKGGPRRQTLKLGEEAGELMAAIARNNRSGVIDAVGDIMVVLTILAEQLGCEYKVDEIFTSISTEKIKMDVTKNSDVTHYASGVFAKIADLIRAVSYGLGTDSHHLNSHTMGMDLSAICYIYQTTPPAAYASAYDVIKDRKGKMVNGVFVKEEDLPTA